MPSRCCPIDGRPGDRARCCASSPPQAILQRDRRHRPPRASRSSGSSATAVASARVRFARQATPTAPRDAVVAAAPIRRTSSSRPTPSSHRGDVARFAAAMSPARRGRRDRRPPRPGTVEVERRPRRRACSATGRAWRGAALGRRAAVPAGGRGLDGEAVRARERVSARDRRGRDGPRRSSRPDARLDTPVDLSRRTSPT